jgi:hypothetical protein
VDSQVCSMNWNSPLADDVRALAAGLSELSRCAVRSRKSKSTPVALAALRMAATTPSRPPTAPRSMAPKVGGQG